METAELTLVLGATGPTGRRVADRLAGRGTPTRLASRRGQPGFDWTDEQTWRAALAGAAAVYLVYEPDLAVFGAAGAIGRFARLAVATGVRRLVLLSGRGARECVRAEQAVAEAGAGWTIVRSALFAQNFSENRLRELVRAGVVALPAAEVGEPFVDAEDVADVVVSALTEDVHSEQLYELTGPRLLTFAQAVAEIGAVTGRDISYRQVARGEFIAGLVMGGVPQARATEMTEALSAALDGRNTYVTNDLQRLLGRPPRDFAEYARDTASTGVWN